MTLGCRDGFRFVLPESCWQLATRPQGSNGCLDLSDENAPPGRSWQYRADRYATRTSRRVANQLCPTPLLVSTSLIKLYRSSRKNKYSTPFIPTYLCRKYIPVGTLAFGDSLVTG